MRVPSNNLVQSNVVKESVRCVSQKTLAVGLDGADPRTHTHTHTTGRDGVRAREQRSACTETRR